MNLAYIIFNDMTLLDLAGVYDVVSRLKLLKFKQDLAWDICAFTDLVRDNHGLRIVPDKVRNDLSKYDAIIVPGGFGTRNLQNDEAFLDWLRMAKEVNYKISVCTGSLLLGAAGFLEDKKATTNFNDYEMLKPYCKEVIKQRIVEDNNVISAGAVSSSIDLGLYLCEKWAGKEATEKIKKMIDYRVN
jgi:cyclohexyl-isocyanide hydratase